MPALDYDQIAAWIHASFLEVCPDAYAAFDALPEFLKADNRDAAARIVDVLAMAGLRLEHRGDEVWPADEQKAVNEVIQRNIQLLAEAEHDGWVASRLRNGWIRSDGKDMGKREHHLLVSHADFPESIRRKREKQGPAKWPAKPPENGRAMELDEEVKFERDKDVANINRYIWIIDQTNYKIVAQG
jgi:hypothetical protein